MSPTLEHTLTRIRDRDRQVGDRVCTHLDTLTKPPGSLGRLETLAIELAEIRGEDFPDVTPPGVLVFAADHGVAAEGVSAFPQEVTAQMVANFVSRGAAINVFARQIGARLEVIDVGVAAELAGDGIVHAKIRPGTGNIVETDAMTRDEAVQAVETGIQAAERMAEAGCRCLIVGEMGIANTTASSAVLAVLTGHEVHGLVGRGTGIAESHLVHKQAVIERAIAARQADADDALDVVSKLGGLEIAAMAGAYLGAAAHRLPVIVDGFIATVAALVACRLCPAARDAMIFGHRSLEPGHGVALDTLQARPLLDLDLRLGEGTGAALAYPLLVSATRMLAEMATFASAGVTDSESR
ncbi:nicotinate-nucleotide--dimethylbenzimidazole phosphoribosyltransferase [Halomonas sp. McH1-25]|uniref:nicotinate-nucleotide--dimethylbenzimidazole phosphoribosyltransferase n=1 Tax=unclassified Halomonas TaxID=2609666 RepID=UPI001EF4430E|nr:MULTISPECIES: nicotinate-nucleotide--dimethylbenzimidazole phosphoribosyltransferase [unclassified Halomonas]MCG7599884.1 nicotinate-nucleotide--dimethylbenzimidazole phosphoribosyltransferase [Halomonas sp. McH1-25]MCP1344386.1 nicotinate-nucleotide--dimethylbenzimidazole phosphoribosyltransferase [Halomonas sp. FL8]MCP1362878.1 nicotinate-nucleotide--dimethylbenzimidazole phosphoribosyltransferase [Halomonas sp. BBD45]